MLVIPNGKFEQDLTDWVASQLYSNQYEGGKRILELLLYQV